MFCESSKQAHNFSIHSMWFSFSGVDVMFRVLSVNRICILENRFKSLIKINLTKVRFHHIFIPIFVK